MRELGEMRCEVCRSGAPSASSEAIRQWLTEIPNWTVVDCDGTKQLTREYRFDNFVDALRFTNLVGKIAEMEDHHPSLLTEWGKVRLTWWTHKIKGLHQNDFVMAAKSDQLYLSL